jgi:group I intron endonuclease
MQGIYKIVNMKNNKLYIGQSIDIENRIKKHKYLLRTGKDSQHLQNAWYKYGEECFCFSIIEIVKDRKELNNREIYWIKIYNSNNEEFGYNISGGGGNIICSDSTREKISKSKKGKSLGKTSWNKGIPCSATTKEKIRAANKGKASHCKINDEEVTIVLQRIKNGEKVRDLAKEYKVAEVTIRKLKNRMNVKNR